MLTNGNMGSRSGNMVGRPGPAPPARYRYSTMVIARSWATGLPLR